MTVPTRIYCPALALLASLVFVASFALVPAPARADCIAPTPAILWSSPARGDTDTALDADLLLVTEGIWSPEVRLGDRLLTEGELPGVYDLGTLEPSTQHTLTVTVDSELQPNTFTITFTTGTETTPPATNNALEVTSMRERVVDSPETLGCDNILYANSCYDTGPPVLHTFEADAGDAVLWLVENIRTDDDGHAFAPLPVSCGTPRQLTWGSDDENRAYVLHAVRADGSIAASEVIDGPFPTAATPDAGAPPTGTNDAGTRDAGANQAGAPDAGGLIDHETPAAAEPVHVSGCAVAAIGAGSTRGVASLLGAVLVIALLAQRTRSRARARSLCVGPMGVCLSMCL